MKKEIIKIFFLIKNFLVTLLEPKIGFYAASMSWSTIFFIIPLLVMIFSIVLHTPIFHDYYGKIHSLVASYIVPTNSQVVMEWIDKFVDNATNMGYIGIGYTVLAAVLFFRDYDYIINDIFDLPRRGILKAIALYASLILLIPVMLGILIWFITISSDFSIAKVIMQFLVVWLFISIIFKLTPKEKLPIKVVAISSFVTTFVWSIAKTLFLLYVAYNKTYTTIYGTISIVLFTFLWIYLSWVIFLHGLQLCNILTDEEDS